MCSDAFSGQYNSRHHDSSEQTASAQGGWFNHWKNVLLFIHLQLLLSVLKMLTINETLIKVDATFICDCPHRANDEPHQLLTAAECWMLKQSVCVFHYKLTDFPVPGFQWYPNTSSRFTVLLLSTSCSSSFWGEKMGLGPNVHKKKQLLLKLKKKLCTFSRGGKWTNPR